MKFEWKRFNELSSSELYAILHLREKVFVVGQNCVYQDADYKDQKAIHCLGYVDGQLAAYSRFFKQDDYMENAISFGRVVTDPKFRGIGCGKALIKENLRYISEHYKGENLHISAQSYLERFYSDFGLQKEGQEYLEDDIPHIAMKMIVD